MNKAINSATTQKTLTSSCIAFNNVMPAYILRRWQLLPWIKIKRLNVCRRNWWHVGCQVLSRRCSWESESAVLPILRQIMLLFIRWSLTGWQILNYIFVIKFVKKPHLLWPSARHSGVSLAPPSLQNPPVRQHEYCCSVRKNIQWQHSINRLDVRSIQLNRLVDSSRV